MILDALQGRTAAPAAQTARLNLNLEKVKKAAQLASAMKNPGAALSSLVQQNPLVRQATLIGAHYGGDYDKAFLAVCQENGIDPITLAQEIKALM